MPNFRIKQVWVSESVAFFRDFYTSYYDLESVNKDTICRDEPCLFVGAYRIDDIQAIQAHKGKVILVWCGADATNERTIVSMAVCPNITHVAISLHILYNLTRLLGNVTHVATPFTDWRKWPLCPLGDKIYSYAPNNAYGRDIVEQVKNLTGFQIMISGSCKTLGYGDLLEAYKQSFIGLRPRRFDGISATVQEMGLMGRRSVWNGGTPSAVPWGSLKDILRAIDRESKYIGQTREFVRQATLEHIDMGDEWLFVEV